MAQPVIVYFNPSWHACKTTREFLSQKGVPFIEKDVIKDPKNLEELAQKTGRRATPTLIIGDEVIVGFEKGEIEKALQKAGIA